MSRLVPTSRPAMRAIVNSGCALRAPSSPLFFATPEAALALHLACCLPLHPFPTTSHLPVHFHARLSLAPVLLLQPFPTPSNMRVQLRPHNPRPGDPRSNGQGGPLSPKSVHRLTPWPAIYLTGPVRVGSHPPSWLPGLAPLLAPTLPGLPCSLSSISSLSPSSLCVPAAACLADEWVQGNRASSRVTEHTPSSRTWASSPSSVYRRRWRAQIHRPRWLPAES